MFVSRLSAILAVGFVTIGGVAQARAQTAPRPGRLRVSVNAGLQPSSIPFGTSTTRTVNLEPSVINTTYEQDAGRLFDGGAAIRVVGRFGAGVAVSWFSKKNEAAVEATIPHVFFFNAPRAINGTAPGLRRDELAVHLQAVYAIRPIGRLDVVVAAGPSFFRVKQAVVSNVFYQESYPYDSATFTDAASLLVSRRRTGFNVGADVGMRLFRNVGVGGLARFSRASTRFLLPDGSASAKSDFGGIQVVGGVRLYF